MSRSGVSLDVLRLLAHLLYEQLQVYGGAGDVQAAGLGAQGIGFAVHFLEQEVQALTGAAGGFLGRRCRCGALGLALAASGFAAAQLQKFIEKYPGVDGIMVGRGVFHNPFAFENSPQSHSREELLGLLGLQLDLYDTHSSQTKRPFDTLKRFFKIYVNSFEGAAELRDKLMHTKSTDEVRKLIK